MIDLPHLKSIRLGYYALEGVKYGAVSESGLGYPCSLKMESDIDND